MKKLIGVLTIVMVALGFTMTLIAAEMDVPCENCPKGVEGPGTISVGAVTVSQTVTSASCSWFDYESASGYCSGTQANNRVIFTLCDCTRGTFNAGDEIPVRFTSMTDGVYFSFPTGLDLTDDGSADAISGSQDYGLDPDYILTNMRNEVAPANDCWATDFRAADGNYNMTDVMYTFTTESGQMYRTTVQGGNIPLPSSALASDGSVIGPWSATGGEFETSTESGNSCQIPESSRVTKVTVSNAYTIRSSDIAGSNQKFQINLPAMRYDIDDITAGDTVIVEIEYGQVTTCGSCFACECQRTLGTLDTCPTLGTNCMYFPYAFVNAPPWDVGLVITDVTSATTPGATVTPLANMTATLTYTDYTGATFSYTKNDFDSRVWSFMLGTILSNFDGTPAAGNGWLMVNNANFSVDGYQFLTNGTFGAGTLPRCCNGICH